MFREREGLSAPTVGVTSTLDFRSRGYGGFVYTYCFQGIRLKLGFGMLHLDLLPGTHVAQALCPYHGLREVAHSPSVWFPGCPKAGEGFSLSLAIVLPCR